MTELPTAVSVRLEDVELDLNLPLGQLHRAGSAASDPIAFSYGSEWLASWAAFPIDPSIPMYEGDQYGRSGRLFGIFSDCAPDRWGRALLERRESIIARRQGRSVRRLGEWDFLLGVSDKVRTGALRFLDESGEPLSEGPPRVPPVTRLRELQHRAQQFEEDVEASPDDEEDELALLIAPGSSLGGARPKANYLSEQGDYWIAKFPSKSDTYDVGAWEQVLHLLAAEAMIEVPPSDLLRLEGRHHAFCSHRFDRAGSGRRLYASAMTLAGKLAGEDASYLDLVDAIERFGDPNAIDRDLREVFTRLVFNVLVSNRDDHLRNHAFLRGRKGWRLAPAFDLNPSDARAGHVLSLDGASHEPDLALAMDTHDFYRIGRADAESIIQRVQAAVVRWRAKATALGLSRNEIDRMAPAFSSDR